MGCGSSSARGANVVVEPPEVRPFAYPCPRCHKILALAVPHPLHRGGPAMVVECSTCEIPIMVTLHQSSSSQMEQTQPSNGLLPALIIIEAVDRDRCLCCGNEFTWGKASVKYVCLVCGLLNKRYENEEKLPLSVSSSQVHSISNLESSPFSEFRPSSNDENEEPSRLIRSHHMVPPDLSWEIPCSDVNPAPVFLRLIHKFKHSSISRPSIREDGDTLRALFSSNWHLRQVFEVTENIDEALTTLEQFYQWLGCGDEPFITFVHHLVLDLSKEAVKSSRPTEILSILVLLEHPMFRMVTRTTEGAIPPTSNYSTLGYLLGRISYCLHLENEVLKDVLALYPLHRFKRLLALVHEFLDFKLRKGSADARFVPQCSWEVICGVKALNFLSLVSEASSPRKVEASEFSVPFLRGGDALLEDFDHWVSGQQGFSFCLFPIVLPLSTKRTIMEMDNRRAMLLEARRAVFSNLANAEQNDPFLSVQVRRMHVLEDSLAIIGALPDRSSDFKKKIKVSFIGEPGIDYGGLTKEWFQITVEELFSASLGLFVHVEASPYMWFDTSCTNTHLLRMAGCIMGLALYNGIVLDTPLPPCCFDKMFGVQLSGLSDLAQVQPVIAKSLQDMLQNKAQVGALDLTFQVLCGGEWTNLCPHGEIMAVTPSNIEEFVALYSDLLLNKACASQAQAFVDGFLAVCGGHALSLFRPEEVKILCCGVASLDFFLLYRLADYENCSASSPQIIWLWEIIEGMSEDLRRKLIWFMTGSTQLPFQAEFSGFRLRFVLIQGSTDLLPYAHTCSNQLCMFPYQTKTSLKTKLLQSICETQGFGFV